MNLAFIGVERKPGAGFPWSAIPQVSDRVFASTLANHAQVKGMLEND